MLSHNELIYLQKEEGEPYCRCGTPSSFCGEKRSLSWQSALSVKFFAQRGVQLVLKYLIIVVKRALRVREVEKLIMCETKEKGSSRKSYGHTNVLVDMMQNYPGFMDYIAYQYPLEGERIELLEQILTALAVGRKLEAVQMIYHYGSMIHGRDLIARQVFLWLLGMAEYSRRECIAEERR